MNLVVSFQRCVPSVMSTRSPTYRLPTRRRAEAPAERPAEAEVPVGSESPDAVSCEDHSYLRGLTPAVLSSLTTPSRSNPASVDSLPFSHSPPGASPGASMLSDDETEEEAELRREQEQEQARRLYAANGSSLAALDARAAEEEAARKAEQMAMLSLLKKNNLLDTLQPRSEAEAEWRCEQRSGLAMFRSRAGDLCRDARLDMPDTAELQRKEVSASNGGVPALKCLVRLCEAVHAPFPFPLQYDPISLSLVSLCIRPQHMEKQ